MQGLCKHVIRTNMSVNILYSSIFVLVSLYLVTRPIATPAVAEDTGIPASSSAKLPPQTVAIEEEPFRRIDTFNLQNFWHMPHIKEFLIESSLKSL